MNTSRLSQHKIKKGLVRTPLNDGLGDQLKLSSWTKERLPEYLWLGLILFTYDRKVGIEKAMQILYELSNNVETLSHPKLSEILNLTEANQRTAYKIIIEHTDKDILAPLTIFYKNKDYPIFNEYFFNPNLSFENRLSKLLKIIQLYFQHQSYEATDLRFLSLCLIGFKGKLVVGTEAQETKEALKNYPHINHKDERMRQYRPIIRALVLCQCCIAG